MVLELSHLATFYLYFHYMGYIIDASDTFALAFVFIYHTYNITRSVPGPYHMYPSSGAAPNNFKPYI